MESKALTIHYGDGNGPLCGTHFQHEGLVGDAGDVSRVTCRRCRLSPRYPMGGMSPRNVLLENRRKARAAAALGKLGGKAGTGEAKRRGGSAYYKALRARRTEKDAEAQEQASRRCDNGCALWCVRTIGHDGPCAR